MSPHSGLVRRLVERFPAGNVSTTSARNPPVVGAADRRLHVLTIALEDYFQVTPLQTVVHEDRWYRFERRLETSARRTLDLLDDCGARATFFVLGWVADAAPGLVRELVERGHEVASKGYHHRALRAMTPEAFRDDARRARHALEQATGRRVQGYRLAQGWIRPRDFWALEILGECGYVYDSSVRLLFRTYAAEPWRQFPHSVTAGAQTLLEVPLSSIRLLGMHVPIAGGNYFRQFPRRLVRRAVAHWDRRYPAPFVMYFHTWELDPDQPRINGVPWYQQVRQYRNLALMPDLVRQYMERYRFTSVTEFFGLGSPAAEPDVGLAPAAGLSSPVEASAPDRGRQLPAVAIVVPCYNEEQSLPYLANTLRSVTEAWGHAYRFELVCVDDRSTDDTWEKLKACFADWPRCTLVRHDANQGVAAAIQTGIRAARAGIVCSIDCDCTYDPHDLGRMIPLLTDGVDVVTASPYHPQGAVRNVPRWRLFLSRTLSRLYRLVLKQKIHTYTSCFRVYRREAVVGIRVERGGFFGVTEMLGRLDLAGRTIAEFPTTLEARVLGRSKMKVLRTIRGHLSLLGQLVWLRLRADQPQKASLPEPVHE